MSILVLSGGNHPYEESTPELEKFLKLAGHSPYITDDSRVLTSNSMTDVDTIIFNTLRVEAFSLTKNEQTSLKNLIKNGTGFVSLHISSCLPENWPEFHDLTGGGWIMGTSTHPPYGQFKVDVTDPSHHCAHEIGDFITNDELYTNIGWKPENDVFLSAKLKGKAYPMAWTRSYFKGRVFNTVLGHDSLSFQTPSFQQLVLNGIQWASSKT